MSLLPVSSEAESSPPTKVLGRAYDCIWTKDAHGGAYRKARCDRERLRELGRSGGHADRDEFHATNQRGFQRTLCLTPLQACGEAGGYDAVTHLPDGTLIKREPGAWRPANAHGLYRDSSCATGYEGGETVITGPTTNFVGNHMTQARCCAARCTLTELGVSPPQGAIDLVQSELCVRAESHRRVCEQFRCGLQRTTESRRLHRAC
jgi:hypothetical protein